MEMEKKFFTTKKNIRWKTIDIIVFSIIFLICSRNFIINIDDYINFFVSHSIMINVFMIILSIILIIITGLPFIMIYLGLRYAIKKHNKSVVTFDVEQDLEYYREKFNGISPATMSLLMDLNLEPEKDLGAMKLYYELNDIYMYVRDGNVGINNPKGIKLNYSDERLLKYFFDNNDLLALNGWKEGVIRESIHNNLIIKKNDKDRKKVGCGIFLVLHILALVFIIYFYANNQYYFDTLDIIINDIETLENGKEVLTTQESNAVWNMIITNKDYVFCIFMMLFFILAFGMYFWSAIGGIIHLITGKIVSTKDKLKRTNEGNMLAEKLYGMKNFINDFSNLDEASKKHLVLWDEFLIYAVVLEENENILNEISSVYHTDLLKYKNFKN